MIIVYICILFVCFLFNVSPQFLSHLRSSVVGNVGFDFTSIYMLGILWIVVGSLYFRLLLWLSAGNRMESLRWLFIMGGLLCSGIAFVIVVPGLALLPLMSSLYFALLISVFIHSVVSACGSRDWVEFSWRNCWGKTAWILLFVFLVAFSVRIYKVGQLSTWQDETKEAVRVYSVTQQYGLGSGYMVRRVRTFAQPPLTHYLQQLGIAHLGFSVMGIRIHSVLAGALVCVALTMFWSRIQAPRSRVGLLSISFLILPVFNRNLIYYSQESRPYMTATLFASFCLLAYYDFIFRHRGGISWEKVFFLFVVQLAYLLSVGFQPLIVLFTACLTLFPLLFCRTLRKRVIWTWISAFCAVLFYFPWQTLPLTTYKSYLISDNPNLTSLLQRLVSGDLTLPGLSRIRTMYCFLLGLDGKKDFGFCLSILGVATIFSIVYIIRRRAYRRAWLMSFLLGFSLVFPWVISMLYALLINYHLNARYYITAAPFILATVGFLIVTGLEGVVAMFPAYKTYMGVWIVRFLSVCFFSAISVAYGSMKTPYVHHGGYLQTYRHLDDISEQGDCVYSHDYRLRGAFQLYKGRYIKEMGSFSDLIMDIRKDKINQETKRIFIAICASKKYDPARIQDLADRHETVSKVFRADKAGITLFKISAKPEGMIAALLPLFMEWSAWLKENNEHSAILSDIEKGIQSMRLLYPEIAATYEIPDINTNRAATHWVKEELPENEEVEIDE